MPFSASALGGFAVAAEELGEDVAEAAGRQRLRDGVRRDAARRAGGEIGEIEAAEIEVGPARAAAWLGSRPACAGIAVLRIEAELVVHLTLLGVAQDVVGFLDVLEALLGGLVARIQIGMVLARELAVGLADFVRIGVARHAQRFVVVVLGSRHRFQNAPLRP